MFSIFGTNHGCTCFTGDTCEMSVDVSLPQVNGQIEFKKAGSKTNGLPVWIQEGGSRAIWFAEGRWRIGELPGPIGIDSSFEIGQKVHLVGKIRSSGAFPCPYQLSRHLNGK